MVALGRSDAVFLDAYDGRILGKASRAGRDSSGRHGLAPLARMEGESRATGTAITGASNLAFLFLVLSGAILWWPRERSWPSVRAVRSTGAAARPRARLQLAQRDRAVALACRSC